MRVGVDLMGGDSSPQELFQAVLEAAKELSTSDVLVVFVIDTIVEELRQAVVDASIELIAVSEQIEMNEAPLIAIRRKKNSSLLTGLRQLKEGQLDAFVSAGNTGALIAGATVLLSTLPGIDRPALLAVLPTQKGSVAVLDVGGNVSVKAKQLVQFAKMGVSYQQRRLKIASPSVGLLNIGIESLKGTSELREAYQQLQKQHSHSMTFVGNVEASEVFQGKVDVLVTDGFTGNIFLKTAEGVSSFLLQHIKQKLAESASAFLTQLEHKINREEYPGALLCGVNGIVIKCHGASSARSLLSGIRGAFAAVKDVQ